MKLAASLHRNCTAPFSSEMSPKRLIGVLAMTFRLRSVSEPSGFISTARLVESIVMMNAGLIPVYSSKDADILNYRKGLISFYENETYDLYVNYFLDKQIARIKELDTGMEI